MLVPVIAGCNNTATDTNDTNGDNTTTENAVENNAGNNTGNNADNRDQDFKFSFTDFDLNVNYQDTAKNYKAAYRAKTDNEAMEVTVQDPKANVTLTGDEAMDKLKPLLDQLKFDKDTPDQEVIDQVVDVFQLDKDYQNFDLKVVFTDGTKKEYKDQK